MQMMPNLWLILYIINMTFFMLFYIINYYNKKKL